MKALVVRRALLLLTLVFVLGPPLLADDDDWDDDDHNRDRSSFFRESQEGNEDVSEALGSLALFGFVALNSLYYYSMSFKLLPKPVRAHSPGLLKVPLKLKNMTRNFHYLGNPVFIGIAWLHGVTAEESNTIVWVGWGIMVLLALTGLIMKLQRADAPGAKVNRLIHSQHLLSIIMVLALVIGHGFLD